MLGHPVTAQPAADGRDIADDLLMDRIRADWSEIYDLGYAGGSFLARLLIGGDLLSAKTPAGLESAIRADFTRYLSAR